MLTSRIKTIVPHVGILCGGRPGSYNDSKILKE